MVFKGKRVVWTPEAEKSFVEIWAEHAKAVKKNRNKTPVYQKISKKFAKKHFDIAAHDVKAKITNLTTKYRQFKKAAASSGASSPKWPLYHKIDQILGGEDESPYASDSSLRPPSGLLVPIRYSNHRSRWVRQSRSTEDDSSSESMETESVQEPTAVAAAIVPPECDNAQQNDKEEEKEEKTVLELFKHLTNSMRKTMELLLKQMKQMNEIQERKLKVMQDQCAAMEKLAAAVVEFVESKKNDTALVNNSEN